MIQGSVRRRDNGLSLLTNVRRTTNMLERMRGLLFQHPLQYQQGLLIQPCSSIHTFGMRYSLDLMFLDRNWRVRKLIFGFKPGRIVWVPGAHMVIELPEGVLKLLNLTLETQLDWEETA